MPSPANNLWGHNIDIYIAACDTMCHSDTVASDRVQPLVHPTLPFSLKLIVALHKCQHSKLWTNLEVFKVMSLNAHNEEVLYRL